MRIILPFVLIFILVAELHARPPTEQEDQLLKKRHVEEARTIEKSFWTPPPLSPEHYTPPQTVLDDRKFENVKEYPDGYTGYNCSKIGNLRYTLEACSQYVWECTDGKLFKKTCPKGLIFWFNTQTCDVPTSKELTCKEGITTRPIWNGWDRLESPPRWPLSLQLAANVTNEPLPYDPTSEPIMITTDCRKVVGGIYKLKGCHPEYLMCAMGGFGVQRCPDDLVFDERLPGCVTMESCKEPHANHTGAFELGEWIEESVKQRIPQQGAELFKIFTNFPAAVPLLVTVDCRRSFDGAYEAGKCHPNIILCSQGKRPISPCGTIGHVYKDGMACMDLKSCQEAWDNEEKSTTPFTIVEQTEQPPSSTKPFKGLLVSTVEECSEKDGRYAIEPCQAEYIDCSSGSGSKLKCSNGFVFSSRFGECVGEEFCDE